MKLSKMFKSDKKKATPQPKKVKEYDWKFGGRSLMKLDGVNPKLVEVCHRALTLSSIDFGITCGLRTQHEQNQLVIQGKSQVKHSRHQDGDAIDIVTYINGKVSWDLEHYIVAAEGFHLAAKELGVDLRWGAAWTHNLKETSARQSYEGYISMRERQGRRPFVDGPHFELPKE